MNGLSEHCREQDGRIMRLTAAVEAGNKEIKRLKGLLDLSVNNPVEQGWLRTIGERTEAAVVQAEGLTARLTGIGAVAAATPNVKVARVEMEARVPAGK